MNEVNLKTWLQEEIEAAHTAIKDCEDNLAIRDDPDLQEYIPGDGMDDIEEIVYNQGVIETCEAILNEFFGA